MEGKKEFQWEWKGALWLFSKKEYLERFKKTPEKYAPQYGGYCAFAVAKGDLVSVDPTQFSIVDDKLYLNYSAHIQKRWQNDRDSFILKADKNWPKLF